MLHFLISVYCKNFRTFLSILFPQWIDVFRGTHPVLISQLLHSTEFNIVTTAAKSIQADKKVQISTTPQHWCSDRFAEKNFLKQTVTERRIKKALSNSYETETFSSWPDEISGECYVRIKRVRIMEIEIASSILKVYNISADFYNSDSALSQLDTGNKMWWLSSGYVLEC